MDGLTTDLIASKNTSATVKSQAWKLSEKKNDYLTGEILMPLHTRVGRSLFVGLLRFAKPMHSIYQAAKENDLYAEWYLLKTQQTIQMTQAKVKQLQSHYQQTLNQVQGLEIQLFGNQDQAKFPLHFLTPFSYMAARLLADVDYLVRQIYTLKRLGVAIEENNLPKTLMRWMHELFAIPKSWQYTGVTRKDVAEDNQKAQQAKLKMGEVPLSVLNKEISSLFLPKVRKQIKI